MQTLTLITGDKVTVKTAADGTVTRSMSNPNGRVPGFSTSRVGTDTYMYPDSALPFVTSGQLDRNLFDITQLLADGYDDARTQKLPLIVTYTDAAARSRTQVPLPEGATKTASLDSIQGAALSEPRKDAANFWSSLTPGAVSAAGRTAGTTPRLGRGIAKIWLDGKAKAELADTTAQIGAPQVWDSGYTGKGVDVAVLDTGIDTQHPDLAGQVNSSESFVPGEDIEDRNGHGTHVASTIAGTGAASDGKEKGVAPGARLHVGKVLNNDGSGQDSWITAGMEWAARDQHAKIISMSLGGAPTDGSDPLSQAVESLSHETGALFTIAAGNRGRNTVSAPSVADAALSVGAVDGADQLASFSSTGPRHGDAGLKPELTAPGVNVLAARSQYASEGEGYYQTLSGTSMATPHVAGAAALLAQEHPDWTGQQLKDALVSTTKLTPHYTPYQAGDGRLDIANTANSTVFATGSVYGGYRAEPLPAGETSQKTVTYTNTGSSPVTLNLTVAPSPGSSAGVFSLSAQQVTVPANGSTSLTLTTHFDAVQTSQPTSGQILACDAAGTTLAHTVIGAFKDVEKHRLNVTAKDRSGRPLAGQVTIAGDVSGQRLLLDDKGTGTATLPVGNYAVWTAADVEGAHGPHSKGLAVLTSPQIHLDKDVSLTLDATAAKQVKVITPQESTTLENRVDVDRTFDANHASGESWLPDNSYDSIWALPTQDKPASGIFEFGTSWRLAQPTLTVASETRDFDDLLTWPGSNSLSKGAHGLNAVYAGLGDTAAYTRLDAQDKIAVVRRNDTVSPQVQADAAAAAGAAMLLIVNDGTGRLVLWPEYFGATPAPKAPLPVATITADEGGELITQIQHGKTALHVKSHPSSEYLYDIAHHEQGIPAYPTLSPKASDLARVNVSFRNNAPGRGWEMRSDLWKGNTASNLLRAPVQGDRTDWVSTDVDWDESAYIENELTILSDSNKHYAAGTTSTLDYFGPIQRPRMGDSYRPVRVGNLLVVQVPTWTDSGAGHIGLAYDNYDVRSTEKLYLGDQLIASNPYYNMLVPDLAPEPKTYRLVSENSRNTWQAPYSTSTRTEWTFTSGEPANGTVELPPFIQLDYSVAGMDDNGKARRTADLVVNPTHLAAGPSSATIGKVGIDVSYDDGATWHHTTVKHTSHGWRTPLDAPAGAQFISLRTSAGDTQGNSVTQEIIRAFGLK